MPSFIYSQLFVKPPYPTTSCAGQSVIVTGSNVGLGLEAARHFVRLGAAKVILAVRNTAAGEDAKRSIEQSTKRQGVCEVWELDLASYASVKSFAAQASKLPRLDVLLENAAIATRNFALAENDERSITVNVVSTFLLALLLLPKLRETAKKFQTTPRLTIVTSEVHSRTNLPERDAANIFKELTDNPNMKSRYPTSKLLEVLLVREIAPQIKDSGVILNLVNPGLCHSKLSREAPWILELVKFFLARSTEVGSRTLVHGATAGPETHGQYLSDARVADEMVSQFVKSPEGEKAQKKVWGELREKLEAIQPGVTKNLA